MVKANTYCLSCDSQDISSLIILTHVIHTNTISGVYIYIYIYLFTMSEIVSNKIGSCMHIFLYTFFWLHWVFAAVHGLSLVAVSRDDSPLPFEGFWLW